MRRSNWLLTRGLMTSLVCAGVFLAGNSAQAGQTGSVIVAAFSDPVLSGNLLPLPGNPSYFDNTSTAFDFINNSTDTTLGGTPLLQQTGSQLVWGNSPGFSSLTFFGRPIPADPSVPFDLGFLAFGNGTSQLNSLIFGATITFYLAPPNSTLAPGTESIGSSTINIVTTANLGVAGSEAHDADFISLSGLAGQTYNVYEGAAAGAELYGYIVGDPVLHLTGFVLAPGQSGNGFIGNGQPAVSTPEPSTLALAGISTLCSLAVAQRRRRKSSV
jgi:hypothetical protein